MKGKRVRAFKCKKVLKQLISLLKTFPEPPLFNTIPQTIFDQLSTIILPTNLEERIIYLTLEREVLLQVICLFRYESMVNSLKNQVEIV